MKLLAILGGAATLPHPFPLYASLVEEAVELAYTFLKKPVDPAEASEKLEAFRRPVHERCDQLIPLYPHLQDYFFSSH